jgi:hypothetical protein
MKARNAAVAESLCIAAGLVFGLATSASGQGGSPTSTQRWQVRYQIERYLDTTAGGTLLSTETVTGTWNGATWSFTGRERLSGDVTSVLPIGRVDITLQGRVGIVGQNASNPGDTTRPTSQRNYGINRLGGSGGFDFQGVPTGFTMTFRDNAPNASAAPARLERGLTGETRPDAVTGPGPVREYPSVPPSFSGGSGGDPTDPASYGEELRGAFMPFRVGFSPLGGQFSQGQNNDGQNNGTVRRLASGELVLAGITAPRSVGFGLDGTTALLGVAMLDTNNQIVSGDWANYYRMTYTPNALATPTTKTVSVTVAGQNLSYMYLRNTPTAYSSTSGSGTPRVSMPTHSFDFLVSSIPTPGSAAALVLGGLLAARRRR